jgi:nicotinate-nucleotide adenylyltransferase
MSLRDLLAAPAGRIMTFAMTPIAISSTAMRALLQASASIRYLTPDPVVGFIHQHQLYGSRAVPA